MQSATVRMCWPSRICRAAMTACPSVAMWASCCSFLDTLDKHRVWSRAQKAETVPAHDTAFRAVQHTARDRA